MITLLQWAAAHNVAIETARAMVDSGALPIARRTTAGRIYLEATAVPREELPAERPYVKPRSTLTTAEIIERSCDFVDAADIKAALASGTLLSRTRASVDAWLNAGAPVGAERDEARQIAEARAGGLTIDEIIDLQADRRRLALEVERLTREVARLTLAVRKMEAP